MDILLFSSSDWHGNWGSRQQVAQGLSQRGHRVLYIEQQAGLEHVLRYPDLRQRRANDSAHSPQPIQDNLWRITPPVLWPGRYVSTAVARRNARTLIHWLCPHLESMGIHRPLLWFYKPEQTWLTGHFNECGIVYHCIDEMTVGTSGRKKKRIQNDEAQLIRQSDVVFANSELTYQNKKRLNPNTFRIPSGADTTLFHPDQPPDPEALSLIEHTPKPRLIFVGNVNEKIDAPLLASIASQRPDWTVILVGVIRRKLPRLPNLILLGEQPFHRIPTLIQQSDVCLLPYVDGEATRYRSPLKLYEYLASGKPIVSTPHPEVQEFASLIHIAPSTDIIPAIEHSLHHDSAENKQRQLQTAQHHSWHQRIDTMLNHINDQGLNS